MPTRVATLYEYVFSYECLELKAIRAFNAKRQTKQDSIIYRRLSDRLREAP